MLLSSMPGILWEGLARSGDVVSMHPVLSVPEVTVALCPAAVG